MNETYDITLIENNCYPTREHTRLELTDLRTKECYWLYTNDKETKLEVPTPSGSRTYDAKRIPKKYQVVYQYMQQALQKKTSLM